MFSHLEKVTVTLVSIISESESQVVLHACRVLEIMSGCLGNTEICHSAGTLFWDIIFKSVISLAQTSQTILREAACDCLGSINGNVITQLSVSGRKGRAEFDFAHHLSREQNYFLYETPARSNSKGNICLKIGTHIIFYLFKIFIILGEGDIKSYIGARIFRDKEVYW